jgi:hypothetical protein
MERAYSGVGLEIVAKGSRRVHRRGFTARTKKMAELRPCTVGLSASIWRDIAEQRCIGAWGCRLFPFRTSPHRHGFLLARLDDLHRLISTGRELWCFPRSIAANDAVSDHCLIGVDGGDVLHDDLLLPPGLGDDRAAPSTWRASVPPYRRGPDI